MTQKKAYFIRVTRVCSNKIGASYLMRHDDRTRMIAQASLISRWRCIALKRVPKRMEKQEMLYFRLVLYLRLRWYHNQ